MEVRLPYPEEIRRQTDGVAGCVGPSGGLEFVQKGTSIKPTTNRNAVPVLSSQ